MLIFAVQATLAQSVEQRIRNAQVVSSSLMSGSQGDSYESLFLFPSPAVVLQIRSFSLYCEHRTCLTTIFHAKIDSPGCRCSPIILLPVPECIRFIFRPCNKRCARPSEHRQRTVIHRRPGRFPHQAYAKHSDRPRSGHWRRSQLSGAAVRPLGAERSRRPPATFSEARLLHRR